MLLIGSNVGGETEKHVRQLVTDDEEAVEDAEEQTEEQDKEAMVRVI